MLYRTKKLKMASTRGASSKQCYITPRIPKWLLTDGVHQVTNVKLHQEVQKWLQHEVHQVSNVTLHQKIQNGFPDGMN